MNGKQICEVIVALGMAAIAARADSLELKNGSLINGKFMGGTQTSITFQLGSSVQNYDVGDIRSLRFDSAAQGTSPSVPSRQPSAPSAIGQDEVAKSLPSVTIPVGTRISVRTIDAIDSTKNRVGYRFQASLEQPLWVDGNMVVPKGADVYGRLDESKETGTFAGRSQLKLQLTGIVVNGQTLPLVTGEYEVSESTRETRLFQPMPKSYRSKILPKSTGSASHLAAGPTTSTTDAQWSYSADAVRLGSCRE
jgi:hypothetical protein